MFYAFTDESYSPRKYFQAGFIIKEADLGQVEEVIENSKEFSKSLGVSNPTEFHGHSIMTARDGWEPMHRDFNKKIEIFTFFFNQVALLDATLIIENVDQHQSRIDVRDDVSAQLITSRKLLASINQFSAKRQLKTAVISDKISREDRTRIAYDNIILEDHFSNITSIKFEDSHKNPGIQIADMCVYIYRRKVDHTEANHRTRARVEALWEIISPICNH